MSKNVKKELSIPSNLSITSKEDVLNFIMSTNESRYFTTETNFKKHFPYLHNELIKLNFPNSFKFSQKLFHFLHNDNDLSLSKCPICSKELKRFIGFKTGYLPKTCSKECGIKLMLLSYQNTCLKKYGVPNYGMTDEYQIKFKNTCLEKFGCENPFQNEEIKQKIKETNIENLGCENPSQNEDIKQKKIETCLNNFGVEHPSQSDIVLEKFKNTCINTYGVDNPAKCQKIQDKMKKTCLNRYGVEYYPQTNEYKDKFKEIWENKTDEEINNIVNKVKKTKFILYGDENYVNVEQAKKTCLEKYGVEHFSQLETTKEEKRQKCLQEYGVEYYFQTDIFKEKVKQIMLDTYGVEHYAQSSEFSKFRKNIVEYNGIFFDSSWEVILYKYCEKYKIDFEYHPNIQFEYYYNNKKHIYHPDFLIDGKIYEVKGDHFFDDDKMICPFDRNKDELFEAKHQCIKNNGVKILTRYHINKIKEML